MVAVSVWLGGEGPNEIGGRAQTPPADWPGVVEALLLRLEPDGWRVGGATAWCRIRKLEVGKADGEEASILGLVLTAIEEGADVVAFCRDTDGDRERKGRIERAIEAARKHFVPPLFPFVPLIIGGAACPTLEGWMLALLGEHGTDSMSKRRAIERLNELGIAEKDTAAYVALVEQAVMDPACESLARWLDRARAVLREAIHGVAKSNV